jgi:hypothetical protein
MFRNGFRDCSTNQSFSDKRNASATITKSFKDGSLVPGAKKSIVKKSKDPAGPTPQKVVTRDTERVEWMEAHDTVFWPTDLQVMVHDIEEQYDIEAFLQVDEWKRISYTMRGSDTTDRWYLMLPKHIKRALETCTNHPHLVSKYAGTGSRTTHHGVQFFKHADKSLALLRGDGVQCRCGVWHPRRI